MRPMVIIGGSIAALALVGVLAWTRFAPAQMPAGQPPLSLGDTVAIAVQEVDVRSGPDEKFYTTGKLKFGDKVTLVTNSPKAKAGWLAIRLPSNSPIIWKSWINSRLVQSKDNLHGVVDTPDRGEVAVYPESSNPVKAPDVESVKLAHGSPVTFYGAVQSFGDGMWQPIVPPDGEVRFIPESAVRSASSVQTVGTNGSFVPPASGGVSPLDQAELKRREAIQLYTQALQSSDPNQQAQARYWLQILQQAPSAAGPVSQSSYPFTTTAAAGPKVTLGATSAPATGGSTALYTAPTATGPAQWTKWGTLRKTALGKDGPPIYRLEDQRGTPLGYAMAAPGLTLEPYVNKMVCLYGATAYRSDDSMRGNYTVVSQLALP